ncbi:hypothetical protein L5515_019529 [Caenorhabditis briggsae]|uniref:Uncharacterized protein n=1 Tax=Caenorhabditis briggsae TaxID=6238 RepID=A0AAE9FEX3_CAEBR|nr:hypothetical protein L5515_019529 [Caenorhabditis briggsae]
MFLPESLRNRCNEQRENVSEYHCVEVCCDMEPSLKYAMIERHGVSRDPFADSRDSIRPIRRHRGPSKRQDCLRLL